MPVLLDAPRLSTYLRATASGDSIDTQKLAIAQRNAVSARLKARQRRFATANQLSWKFFCDNVQPRNDTERRHFQLYRDLVALVKQVLPAEPSSEELHAALFQMYRVLAENVKSLRNDDDDDDGINDSLLALVSSEQLETLVEIFGPLKQEPISKIAKMCRQLALWRIEQKKFGSLKISETLISDAITSEEFGNKVVFDIDAYLQDKELAISISQAPLFAARKVKKANVPQVYVVAPGTKHSAKPNSNNTAQTKSSPSSSKPASSSSTASSSLSSEPAVNTAHMADLALLAHTDVMDRDWLPVQCHRFVQSTRSGINAHELARSVLQILKSSDNTQALQAPLFELLGPMSFDFIALLLDKRIAILEAMFAKAPPKPQPRPKGRPMPSKSAGVFIRTEEEILIEKLKRKENKQKQKQKKKNKIQNQKIARKLGTASTLPAEWFDERGEINKAMLNQQRQIELGQGPSLAIAPAVDRSNERQFAGKVSLPAGHVWHRDNKKYDEVYIPAKTRSEQGEPERIAITEFPEWTHKAFGGITHLNRLQTKLYSVAFESSENLLVCAPTGAGKTNVALMTVLRCLSRHRVSGELQRDAFKIVYVAPMKALAAEMVRSFSKRLAPLGVKVAELTGDMQLTKAEIEATQMIVTTPEKWDVITRKSNDQVLTQLVKLLIIDEVHLLHEDRGAVLEILVARTLRQVEATQSLIRIVGLSATLPNYNDVARFLRVRSGDGGGLFHFDDAYRPVPLEQRYIGVRAGNPAALRAATYEVCYDKVLDSIKQGNQVMVFVHSRKQTAGVGEYIVDRARKRGELGLLEEPELKPSTPLYGSELKGCRNQQLKKLAPSGIGIHHAGMLRPDRRTSEKLFERGHLKVLVSTATLAWGVNLPAHTVVICGTELYNAQQGKFVEIGMLDVQQIFGRAGRPQYDTSGEGIIITAIDSLPHYLALMTHQMPIESRFVEHLADHLNAEVVLGTVTNTSEAVRWLSYTYLHTRMLKNPMAYGITHNEKQMDLELVQKRGELIVAAANRLDHCRMVRFDRRTGALMPTDLGRAASFFYLQHDTIEKFNEGLGSTGGDKGRVLEDGTPAPPLLSDAELLLLVAQASEFENVKLRDDEAQELEQLRQSVCTVDVKGDRQTSAGKVNTLLQAHLSRAKIESFSLISDAHYVEQNASRLLRGLFEIVSKKRWARLSARLLDWCLMIDHRLWDFQTPLRQMNGALNNEILYKIEQKKLSLDDLVDMPAGEIGSLCGRPLAGKQVKKALRLFPHIDLVASVQPITRTVLRVSIEVTPQFQWADRYHGGLLAWHVWVTDADSELILHTERFVLTKATMKDEHTLSFSIPVREPLPTQYMLHAMCDRFLGAETYAEISFHDIVLPHHRSPHTELLDLRPLPVAAVHDEAFANMYSYTHFNPIQTQAFHTLLHTDHPVLLGAPTGSGKTVAAELAMLRVFRERPDAACVYIGPLKALVRERMRDWRRKFVDGMGKSLVELTGDVTPDSRSLARADIVCTTPEKWDGVSRNWRQRPYVTRVALIVIDEVHLLGEERGPVLEVLVSRMRYIASQTGSPVRFVALSTALANARDLGDWLGVSARGPGLFNFRPSTRPVPLEVHIQGYPGKHYCPRMATMNKPCYAAIETHSPHKPVLVFVASRRQTRLTAMALIGHCAASERPRQFVHVDEEALAAVLVKVRDPHLRHTLSFGVAMHHAGLHETDRALVERLFGDGAVQVLVSTATLAWGINLPAHLVIIKGTEYFDGKTHRYVDFPVTDVLQMMGRAGRPQYDTSGIAVIMVDEPKKNFYKKFLYEPFPVESSLLGVLTDHLNAEIVSGTVASRQDAVDYLTWTYFFRRVMQNPSYYGVSDASEDAISRYMSDTIDESLSALQRSGCIELRDDDDAEFNLDDSEEEERNEIEPCMLGHVASYYYLSHRTVRLLRDEIDEDSTRDALLQTLADAAEFDEFPVRHNEDLTNEELAVDCRYEVPPIYDDPHIKANILLQCYVARRPLPVADYATDTRTVLGQTIRVLQAMVDVAADAGWLRTTLNIMSLVQMLKQARWFDDCPLTTLPNVTPSLARRLRRATVSLGKQRRVPVSLPALLHASPSNVLRVLSSVGMSDTKGKAVLDALRQLPQVSLMFKLSSDDSDDDDNDDNQKSEPLHVSPEAEITIDISLKRIGKQRGQWAYAPHFPKKSPEAVWLVLKDGDELLALRRARADRRGNQTHLVFDAPDEAGRYTYHLLLISDSYLGLDQQFEVSFVVE